MLFVFKSCLKHDDLGVEQTSQFVKLITYVVYVSVYIP